MAYKVSSYSRVRSITFYFLDAAAFYAFVTTVSTEPFYVKLTKGRKPPREDLGD